MLNYLPNYTCACSLYRWLKTKGGFFNAIMFGLSLVLHAHVGLAASADASLEIGWAQTDITPSRPVQMTGLGRAVRVCEKPKDPITATVLVLNSVGPDTSCGVALVSLELLSASECIRDGVRERLRRDLPELPSEAVIFFATHTHTAPFHYTRPRYRPDFEQTDEPWIFRRSHHQPLMRAIADGKVKQPMTCREYVGFVVEQVGDAVVEAWRNRAPGGIAFGTAEAVIGGNRVMRNQGIEDHTVSFMGTYDADGALVGMVINLPAPVQAQTSGKNVSADFMHETRAEFRRRFGENLFLLPQLSAVGDMNPRRDRQQIAERLADAAAPLLPALAAEIDRQPVLRHRAAVINLTRLEPLPDDPTLAIEVHAVRIGGAAMVTNPFELFLDYGLEIKARSPAVATFVVQLAGPGSYLPTARAVEHGGYGATRGSREVGPPGGAELVDWSVETLQGLWQ